MSVLRVAAALADRLDPPPPPPKVQRPELRDPVTLAAHLDPRYAIRAHLELIATEMAELERAWSARDGSAPRLMINTPPQVGKSRTAVEWGAFWWLCLHPTTSIIIGCYGEDLAEDRGGGIRRLVQLHGAAYGLFLQPGESGKKDWSVTAGGSVRAVGVGSGVAGHNADLMFIDDPVRSRADADSVRKREQTYNWYTADMLTRLAPGAPVVLIQTPWDPSDLRGMVLAHEGDATRGGKWRVIVIPALSRQGEAVDEKSTEKIVDPLGRDHGVPIPHPKIEAGNLDALTRHWHEVRQTQDVRTWESLYQCNPKPREGTLLSFDILRQRRAFEHGHAHGVAEAKTVAVGIDPSGGGRNTAGIIGGFLGTDGRCYWSHDRSGVMASDAWARAACELAYEIDADRFIVEVNYGGDMAVRVIRTAWKALQEEFPETYGQRMCPRIVTVRAKRGKLLRAEPIAQQVIEDRVNTSAYLPELESEWTTWSGEGESPGRIDASTYVAYGLLPVPQTGKPGGMSAAHKLADTSLMTWGGSRPS